ncbi:MAG: polyphosphate polymerase domain-containing protein [Solirubrobacterales bacterium]|nr:polyphosphate polymerase domain-containing protein [Solirubrobacterales bacterium]
MSDLDALLGELDPVSLDELDARAALLRRVDNKYALPVGDFERLARQLKSDHQVLEIDGRRRFRYSNNYFETEDLRCFIDHIEDRVPRFKARSRCYEDSEECVFEVKLKRSEDETDKRQIGYRANDRRRLTSQARECLRSALDDVGLEAPEDLRDALATEFERVTLTAVKGSERLTCDFGVRLIRPDGDRVRMRSELVLVETKSETGESPADRELERMGHQSISLSKYRVGMSLVGGAGRFGAQPGSEFFER